MNTVIGNLNEQTGAITLVLTAAINPAANGQPDVQVYVLLILSKPLRLKLKLRKVSSTGRPSKVNELTVSTTKDYSRLYAMTTVGLQTIASVCRHMSLMKLELTCPLAMEDRKRLSLVPQFYIPATTSTFGPQGPDATGSTQITSLATAKAAGMQDVTSTHDTSSAMSHVELEPVAVSSTTESQTTTTAPSEHLFTPAAPNIEANGFHDDEPITFDSALQSAPQYSDWETAAVSYQSLQPLPDIPYFTENQDWVVDALAQCHGEDSLNGILFNSNLQMDPINFSLPNIVPNDDLPRTEWIDNHEAGNLGSIPAPDPLSIASNATPAAVPTMLEIPAAASPAPLTVTVAPPATARVPLAPIRRSSNVQAAPMPITELVPARSTDSTSTKPPNYPVALIVTKKPSKAIHRGPKWFNSCRAQLRRTYPEEKVREENLEMVNLWTQLEGYFDAKVSHLLTLEYGSAGD
jgi:hypothetical protein